MKPTIYAARLAIAHRPAPASASPAHGETDRLDRIPERESPAFGTTLPQALQAPGFSSVGRN